MKSVWSSYSFEGSISYPAVVNWLFRIEISSTAVHCNIKIQPQAASCPITEKFELDEKDLLAQFYFSTPWSSASLNQLLHFS